MAEKPLLLAIDGDTARITLNRPEVRNALSIELSDMLVDAIQTIKKSTEKGGLWKKRRGLAKNFWSD